MKEFIQKIFEVTLLFIDFSKAFDSIHRRKMKQILLAYGLPKETVTAIMMLYKNMKVKICSPDRDTDFFADVLLGYTIAPYLFIICLDYVLWTSIDLMKENGFRLQKRQEEDNILQKLLRVQTTQMTNTSCKYTDPSWMNPSCIVSSKQYWHPCECRQNRAWVF